MLSVAAMICENHSTIQLAVWQAACSAADAAVPEPCLLPLRSHWGRRCPPPLRPPRPVIAMMRVRLLCLPAVALAVSPVPVPIAPAATTCAFYKLSYEYAQHVQPNITAAQQAAVFDALALHACPQSPPRPRALPSSLHTSTAGARHSYASDAGTGVATAVFVDAAKGKDTNPGTLASPLRTLAAAQTAARRSKPATIELRAGVYYLGATLELTALDSGLTIQAYNGENVTISGAQPLSIAKWEPYNVSQPGPPGPPPPPQMSLLPDNNCVFGATFGTNNSHIDFIGTMGTAKACSDACAADVDCSAFTWHDLHQPPSEKQWDGQCYFVKQGSRLHCQPQTHHVSGVKSGGGAAPVAQNVWVAHGVEAPTGMTGLRVAGLRAIRARWPNGDPEYHSVT
jgi:hypothetical protein